MDIRRADMPEPCPAAFANLGPAWGYKVQEFDTEPELDAFLRAKKVDANDAYTRRTFLGGVVPSEKILARLRDGVLRDPPRQAAINQHEVTHTYDLVHHEGRGWFTTDGRAWDDFTPEEQQAWIAARSQPPPVTASFDWSKVGGAFAKAGANPNAFSEGA